MTVSTTSARIAYLGDGASTVFSYPYKFIATSDIKVYVAGVLKTLTTDYSVGTPSDTGANITLVVAPALNSGIAILSDPDSLQSTKLPSNGPFPSTSVETMVDKLTLQVQRLRNLISRSFTLSDGDTTTATPALPTPVGNNIIGWNTAGTALINYVVQAGTSLVNLAAPAGASLIGLFDGLAPAYLKVTSDLLNMDEVSVLRFIDRTKWSAIWGETNADDLSANINAALAANTKGVNLYLPHGLYNADRLNFSYSNSSLRGERGSQLKHTTAGRCILSASGLTGLSVSGVKFLGLGSATAPVDAIGAYSTGVTGLLTMATCNDVSVERCAFSDFYNALSLLKCNNVSAYRNTVRNWKLYGILGSLSSRAFIERNDIQTCDQTGAANAYGIMVTGDNVGVGASDTISISYNFIKGVRSWDGIMSHDVTSLKIHGNIIDDVRIGVDVGPATSANVLDDISIHGNIIKLTSTDTWAAAAANHGGIECLGVTGMNMHRVSISNNEIYNFGANAAMTVSGGGAPITASFCDHLNIVGNTVAGVGALTGATGINIAGQLLNLNITGNNLQGKMDGGGIRGSGAFYSYMTSIVGNVIDQDNVANQAIYFSSGDITKSFNASGNTTNATVPIDMGATNLTANNNLVRQSALTAWNPASVPAGGTITLDIACAGAAMGDHTSAAFDLYLGGLTMSSQVSSANFVRVTLTNNTAGAIDLATGNVIARSWKSFIG